MSDAEGHEDPFANLKMYTWDNVFVPGKGYAFVMIFAVDKDQALETLEQSEKRLGKEAVDRLKREDPDEQAILPGIWHWWEGDG